MTKKDTSEKQYYFLIATEVLYTKERVERTKRFNILILSKEDYVTRHDLGMAQQQAQVRYFSEFDASQKSEIKDVFIMSINNLGHMTEDEFHQGMDQEPTEEDVKEVMAEAVKTEPSETTTKI